MAIERQAREQPGWDDNDLELLHALEDGLPLCSHPFAEIGARVGMSESEVMARIWLLQNAGVVKRFGVVVRHRELGYRANAMVVWDIPDDGVGEIGPTLGTFPFVTLCYRRPRRLPHWHYNLFTMIHGRDREEVLARVEELATHCGLTDVPREVLFSRQRFKQRGARYRNRQAAGATLPKRGSQGQ